MPFYPRERGIILTALAKNGAVNAPLLSSPSQSWVPDPKIYKSSVELLFSSCSADFPLPLLSLNFYLCGREGDIFTMYFGLHQLSLCAWDVCLTKISSQTKLSWTTLSFPVLFKLRKMSDKHCTNIIRAPQIWNSWLTLSSDIQTGSSCCFLISSITLGYQLSMEPAGITAEITTSNVKLCSHFTG